SCSRQVHEAVPCYSECNQYSWVVENWSPCKINNELRSPRCGRGTQSRKIRCVNTADSEGGGAVDSTLCNQDETPLETQSCSLLCPNECVMSEWGTWNKCPQSCDPHTMQRRTRHLLRPSLSSRTCAEDSQVRPCLLNENCFQFQYNLTEWSTCQLSENASCGQGVRTRLLSCVRSDGKQVSMDQCDQLNLEKPQRMSIPCMVECVVNCQLSGWTAWTECSQTCGQGGRMSRTRFIIMPTQGEGRPCPTELTQQKTCPVTPCYSWVLGNWSACKLEGGDCGEGIQVRSLSCVVHNGSISHLPIHIEDALCGEMPFQDSILKQPCSVPCPGGCSPQARPAAIRQCIPACRKPFSYCTQEIIRVLENTHENAEFYHTGSF
ncbi:Thrombospondin type-1 domain-containing protein 7B, partial [Sciurus carolinensis]|nr:Thrombospondin type-1 domain-containing protein 7B [Sciurus carolinensis]